MRLKELRENSKMTQQELAVIIGTTNQTIANWENKKSEPDILTLKKLSSLFKVSIDYLLENNVSDRKLMDVRTDLKNLNRNQLLDIIEKQLDLIDQYSKENG